VSGGWPPFSRYCLARFALGDFVSKRGNLPEVMPLVVLDLYALGRDGEPKFLLAAGGNGFTSLLGAGRGSAGSEGAVRN